MQRAGLGSFRNLEFVLAFKRGDGDLRTHGSLGKGNGNGAKEVFALALEKRMRFYVQDYVKIARRTAPKSRIAILLVADLSGIFYTGGHGDIHHPLVHGAGFAFALGAWVLNGPARTMACGTGARNAEKS